MQDWFWWRHNGEGDPVFNDNYPDVPAELRDLHQNHFHTMISVWGLMDANSANFKKIEALHFDIPNTHVYDPSNPGARDFFWNNLVGPLHAQGWDSFWLDSAEPEEYFPHVGDAILRNKQLHMGSGARYTNIFPLLHTGNVTQHWKDTDAAHPETAKRTLILTRSAFLGQQKNGTVSWSGDVYSTFWGLQPSGRRGPQLRPLRQSLLDHRHRRLLATRRPQQRPQRSQRLRPHQPRLRRALHPLVPVRSLLPRLPLPRPPSPQ